MESSKVSGRNGVNNGHNNNNNNATVNGVVINIAGGGQHQVNNNNNNNGSNVAASGGAKPSRKVRRDASFRLPAFLGGSKRSVNGSSSPGSSRRAPSPSSLSSASSSSSPAFAPICSNSSSINNNNHAKSNTLDVHKHPESVRALKNVADYSSSSSSSSSSNADMISNSVNLKVASDPMSETYKSLGDVFGINAAVASIATSAGNVRSAVKNSPAMPQQQHLKSSRDQYYKTIFSLTEGCINYIPMCDMGRLYPLGNWLSRYRLLKCLHIIIKM